MYKIIVVDDEIATIDHICNIISMKCPEFQVTGVAENGREALSLMEKETPDILITDMRMPIMDGAALLKKIKEKYANVFLVVISGYQDFEYAKVAIKYGVCDYLLKPIKPSSLQDLLISLRSKLNQIYIEKRNGLMKNLCEGEKVDKTELKRFFPFSEQKFYAAIIRKNGLPKRFSNNTGTEVFSGKDELILSYGRDEQEALYLCPENVTIYKSFYQMIAEIARKEQKKNNYVTAVIKNEAFDLENSKDVFQKLYQELNKNIMIGRNQILILEEIVDEEIETMQVEMDAIQEFEHMLLRKNTAGAKLKCKELFSIWAKTNRSQIYVESKVRYILNLLSQYHLLAEREKNCEWLIDELFFYAIDMEDVCDAIVRTFIKEPKKEKRKGLLDSPEFFGKIEAFILQNMAVPISMQTLCRQFGISQTYLSKLFRKYTNSSFNQYLNTIRIERAKELMKEKKYIYVKDISVNVGFEDQFYFSRLFTSMTGMCPSEYMEQLNSLND